MKHYNICQIKKKMTTRSYLDTLESQINFSRQTRDDFCLMYAINNLIQLSPFIRNKSLITKESLGAACEALYGNSWLQYSWRWLKGTLDDPEFCLRSGSGGFTTDALEYVLQRDRLDIFMFKDPTPVMYVNFDDFDYAKDNLGYILVVKNRILENHAISVIPLYRPGKQTTAKQTFVIADSVDRHLVTVTNNSELQRYLAITYSGVFEIFVIKFPPSTLRKLRELRRLEGGENPKTYYAIF